MQRSNKRRIEARLTEASPENRNIMSDILEEVLVEGAIEKVCASMEMSTDEIAAHVHYWRTGVKGDAALRSPEDIIRVGEVVTHARAMHENPRKDKVISDRQLELIIRIVRKQLGM